MANYSYRVFEPCGNGLFREVIFPDGTRVFDSLSLARSQCRKFRLPLDSRICRYHWLRGLEDRDYSI